MKKSFVVLLTVVSILFNVAQIYASPYNSSSQSKELIASARTKTVIITAMFQDAKGKTRQHVSTGASLAGGFIITAAHGVSDCYAVLVAPYKGRYEQASIVKIDEKKDLALLKVKAKIPSFVISTSKVSVGDNVLTIGNPKGYESWSYSEGVILNPSLKLTHEGISYDLISSNNTVIQGNSGGPLLNYDGQLVGIVVMAFEDRNNEGLSVNSRDILNFIGK